MFCLRTVLIGIACSLLTVMVMAQSAECYDPPVLDFSGTPIAMSYVVEDPIFPQDECQGNVADYLRHEYIVPLIELEDRYINIYSNMSSGVTLNCRDKDTDEIIWTTTYNHTNTEAGRAYGITSGKMIGGDTLLVKGHRSWSQYEEHLPFPNASYKGLISDRKISITDGTLYEDSYKGEGYHIYGDIKAYNDTEHPETVEGTSIYHAMGFFRPSADSISIIGVHAYHDSITHKYFINFPPYNDHPPQGSAASIGIMDFADDGSKADGIVQYGPMEVTDSTKTYLLRYTFDSENRERLRIVHMDNWGRLIEHYDVTDALNGNIDKFRWDFKTVDRLGNNLYKIDGSFPNGEANTWGKGYKRYIIIDGYGNLIKERTLYEIDGLQPFLWRSKMLHNGNLLHVFRPVENNNLYMYEELPDGSYRKAGELINHGRPFYAFHPRKIDLTSDGDIFIKNYVAMDSVWTLFGQPQNFNRGGWGVVMKINAEDLSLSTSVANVEEESPIRFYPNPTADLLHIDGAIDNYPLDVSITDVMGRVMLSYTLDSDGQSIDVRTLPTGLYHIIGFHSESNLSFSQTIYKE